MPSKLMRQLERDIERARAAESDPRKTQRGIPALRMGKGRGQLGEYARPKRRPRAFEYFPKSDANDTKVTVPTLPVFKG